MNEGLKKFEELMKTDAAFQEKLKNALVSYNGEQTEEAVFKEVLAPIAKDYGINADFEEVKAYIGGIGTNRSTELSLEEMAQVAGGAKVDGVGAAACYKGGFGFACINEPNCDVKCIIVGIGQAAGGCLGEGQGTDLNF